MSEVINVPAIFGADVFNESAMEQNLSPEIYNAWKHCIQTDTPLGLDVANEIAEAMKEWAIKKGATQGYALHKKSYFFVNTILSMLNPPRSVAIERS